MLLSRPKKCGFTLLELMVVIAIISILASFSTPVFVRQIAKAKLVEVQNLATQHQSLVEEFILINGSFPTAAEFNEIKRNQADSSIVKSLIAENQQNSVGSIRLSLNSDTGVNDGQYFLYTRDSDRNWSCSSDLESNLLPSSCVSMITNTRE